MQDLIGKFNPDNNREDAALLYEITGFVDTRPSQTVNPTLNQEEEVIDEEDEEPSLYWIDQNFSE